MMFTAGTVLAGKYRIERILGDGGMGVVFAAAHLQLHRRVALKAMLPERAACPDLVERFMREARATSKLHSEHVCRIGDVGMLEIGIPYLEMELLEGCDLAALLATQGPLPVAVACEYVRQACVGLAEAHAAGIVHRDLKPANLFLTRAANGRPLIKVLDFGIAKLADKIDLAVTGARAVLGSSGYMSPEQRSASHRVDARSDIWSLGVILYELVTNAWPFGGDGALLPPALDAVIRRCLANDRDKRFQNVEQLGAELVPLASVPIASPTDATCVLNIATCVLDTQDLDLEPTRTRRPRAIGARLFAIAAATCVLLAIGAVRSRAEDRPAAVPADAIEAVPDAAVDAVPDAAVEAVPADAAVEAVPADAAVEASVDAAVVHRRRTRAVTSKPNHQEDFSDRF